MIDPSQRRRFPHENRLDSYPTRTGRQLIALGGQTILNRWNSKVA